MALKDLVVKMRLDNSQFKAGLRDSTKELDNVAKSASSMQGMLQLAGVAGFAMLGKQAISMAWDLGELGAQVDRTGTAFNELARQAGGSGEEMLDAIRTATRGTVSEMDMMAAANKGILLGLGADAQQWTQLTEVAMFRARAMGLTTSQALADITMGIGRESRLILDNLGIILDMDRVTAEYAETLGKTAAQLTEAERKQAILNDVIRVGQAQIQEAGGIAEDSAEKFERLKTAWSNWRAAAGEKMAPITAGVVEELTLLLELLQGDLPSEFAAVAAAAKVAGKDFEGIALAVTEAAKSTSAFPDKVKLTAEQLIAIGELAGATDIEIIELANTLGIDLPNAFIAAATAAGRYADYANSTVSASDKARAAADDTADSVYNLAAAYELLYENTAAKAKARITGEDVWSFGDPYELESGMTGALEAIAEQEEANAARAEELAEQYTRTWDKAYDAQEQRLRDLRSTIESALSPTSVTALDMFQTEQGTYTDKWDEAARRADAIASGGFGELQAHPDWAAALKIPPEILTANEDVLKEWATTTADQVRNLMRPDLLDVDAAVAAVKQSMQDAAAKELSIDLIANAMIAEGAMDPETAKKQVAQALGLDQTFAGENMGQQMMDGLKTSMETSNPAAQFAGYVQKNTEANTALLRTTGENLWHVINIGIDVAMKHTEYAKKLASIIAPEVAQILQERGVWGGTTP